MFENQASRTADRVALERAAHQVLDSPVVFVDPLAMRVIDARDAAGLRDHPDHYDARTQGHRLRALVVIRSRIAEDELAAGRARGVRQYVVLGAGFDTFACRNPFADVRVFEVDHPSTQQLKRERLAAARIEIPTSVTYVPCDFARDSLSQVLDTAGFDRTRPAVVAWLGVVMYLERADAMTTLTYTASLAPGSAVVFDYVVPPDSVDETSRVLYQRLLDRLISIGEPWKTFCEPAELEHRLRTMGFSEIDDLNGDQMTTRYLANRADGLRAGRIGHVVVARKVSNP